MQDLPLFKCHKMVRAAKIVSLTDGGMVLQTHVGPRFERKPKAGDFFARHQPRPNGYYVVYEDGYESYSPAQAFEGGYHLADAAEQLEHSYEQEAKMLRERVATLDEIREVQAANLEGLRAQLSDIDERNAHLQARIAELEAAAALQDVGKTASGDEIPFGGEGEDASLETGVADDGELS